MHRQLTISIGLIQYKEKLLLTRRIQPEYPQWHHRWGFPGGKINPGEEPLEALHREIFEETKLNINSPRLLGVYTHHWQTMKGTQQTFILVYHCYADHDHVILKLDENDEFIWEKAESIIKMNNLLDGTIEMLQKFYFELQLSPSRSLLSTMVHQ